MSGDRSTCRLCGAALHHVVVDLGRQPLANSYVEGADLGRIEPRYPLRPLVCEACWLVQLEELVAPHAIFGDYAYFSSYSASWLEHARSFAAAVAARLSLGPGRLVVEIGSNDGYLLRSFVELGIGVLGVEPAANVAAQAARVGVPTVCEFFGAETAERLRRDGTLADLIVANNVLAHVPDLNGFVEGMKLLLAPGGTITLEFPHLLRLVEELQFDTIYHEHFSYFSLATARAAFARHGLCVVDVEELATHGGSLRLYVRHGGEGAVPSPAVDALVTREAERGLFSLATFERFAAAVDTVRAELRAFLERARAEGAHVAGYGAPAKASTLLNSCGVSAELVAYTVDVSPHKQGRFLPGCRVPVHAPARVFETKPDYLLVFVWNLLDEVRTQMAGIAEWGGRFVVPVPRVAVLDGQLQAGGRS